jgi:hypothetical protein
MSGRAGVSKGIPMAIPTTGNSKWEKLMAKEFTSGTTEKYMMESGIMD